jgi:hypothetical protein
MPNSEALCYMCNTIVVDIFGKLCKNCEKSNSEIETKQCKKCGIISLPIYLSEGYCSFCHYHYYLKNKIKKSDFSETLPPFLEDWITENITVEVESSHIYTLLHEEESLEDCESGFGCITKFKIYCSECEDDFMSLDDYQNYEETMLDIYDHIHESHKELVGELYYDDS